MKPLRVVTNWRLGNMEALPSRRRLQSVSPEREAAEGQTEAPSLDPAKPPQQQLLQAGRKLPFKTFYLKIRAENQTRNFISRSWTWTFNSCDTLTSGVKGRICLCFCCQHSPSFPPYANFISYIVDFLSGLLCPLVCSV